MRESTSKIFLAFEALVFAVPMTLLFGMIFFDWLISALEFGDGWVTRLLAMVFAFASLVAGWWLMVRFWRYDSARLATAPVLVWALVTLAAVAVIAAFTLVLLSSAVSSLEPFTKRVAILAFGLPLLVPLAHLGAERLFRSTADNTLK